MEIGKRLQTIRETQSLNQKELGKKLETTAEKIAAWETGKALPDLNELIHWCELLTTKLATSEAEKIKKAKRKNIKKLFWSGCFILACGLSAMLLTYQYENELVDRFNPFLKKQIGYTVLPQGTIDKSKEYWVNNDIFGEGTWLAFTLGETTAKQNFAVIKHKGSYVYNARIIEKKAIPKAYQDLIPNKYDSNMMSRGVSEPK